MLTSGWGIFGSTVTLTVNEPAVTMTLDQIRNMPQCEFVALWKVRHNNCNPGLAAVWCCLGPEGISGSLQKGSCCVLTCAWRLFGAACGCWRRPEALLKVGLPAALDHFVLACLSGLMLCAAPWVSVMVLACLSGLMPGAAPWVSAMGLTAKMGAAFAAYFVPQHTPGRVAASHLMAGLCQPCCR